MQGAIVIRWRSPRSGHEVESLRLADEATIMWSTLADAGQISGYEWLSGFTGTDGGMLIVRGDQLALGGIMMSPEFMAIHLRGVLHHDDWRVDIGMSGSTVDEVYPGWRELVGG